MGRVRWWVASALGLALAGCSSGPPATAVAVPPVVHAAGAPVSAVWQAGSLILPVVTGEFVVGLVAGTRPPVVRALAGGTGRLAWQAELAKDQPEV